MPIPEPTPADPPREAIPRLLDLHGGRIYALGLELCGGPAEAEDLVQETFLRAFRHWERFEGRSRPSTWLYTIAARACQRLHRKRAGEPDRIETLDELLPAPGEAVTRVPDPEEDPHGAAVRREAEETVERALAELSVIYRLPLVLKDIVELTTAEVAAVLDLEPATVKTRVHRARLKLRSALEVNLGNRSTSRAEDPPHAREVCLDLLAAKQLALDRGVELPVSSRELCDRCRAFFSALDLARDACASIGAGELPPEVRRAVTNRIEGLG